MNYKIRITAENQAIVKRIADENNMNQREFRFSILDYFYLISDNNFFRAVSESDYTELTTEQFIAMFDKKETELDKWLRETKSKNLKANELWNEIARLPMDISKLLEGDSITNKTYYLLTEWNNTTEKSPKVETEWHPKRGDRVLVWDIKEDKSEERIFLADIKGSSYPIIVVGMNSENEFINNKTFKSACFMNMKPLPIEQPKETDFKTKVIELIEGKINDLKGYEKRQIERNEYYNNHSQVASKIKVYNDLINDIKQL